MRYNPQITPVIDTNKDFVSGEVPPTSENSSGFSDWCVLARLITNPRNYS